MLARTPGDEDAAQMPEPLELSPLARATAVLGRPWTLLIIDALVRTPCRFSELTARLPGISTNLLTERLRQLQVAGLVERRTSAMPDFVISYALTEHGMALAPVVEQLAAWAETLPKRK